ncbi:MAG: transferase hexapeptide repeat containing protein [Deltaproteobacteria bacterium]|jgi:carbonic anhydrase/acetyltransferase-like protein (isoleucine patch superfamily)|nr:transferase hexapeptide repeat containing protein [Deltaproteobacteria bacterium]
MNTLASQTGIRPNFIGDWPKIDPAAFVDPSAQILGNVHIGPDVYVGPLSVIRADEPGPDGKVHPVIIEGGSYVQDGVIIHAREGTEVRIGSGTNLAHGVIIHGPCVIGEGCFLALRVTVYNSTLEEAVWVGVGAIIMRATIPSRMMIPAGSVIHSKYDVRNYRVTNEKEIEYQKDVFRASAALRDGYRQYFSAHKSK